jgi:bifunctional DNA-binding transcriptional regulator/antitoxin component of YhaV-PrlF toxin-antitoxin module
MIEKEIILKETTEGDLFFTIPDEVLERLGWKEGDDLKFEERNGSVLIKKIKYETIELEFDDDELFKYMKYAHQSGITFNQLCEDAVRSKLNEIDSE